MLSRCLVRVTLLAMFVTIVVQMHQPYAMAQALATSATVDVDSTVGQPFAALSGPACKPNPERDLSGTLDANGRGVVSNQSSVCSYAVGIAAYRMFDEKVNHQQIDDWRTTVVAPGQAVTLNVKVPDCTAQVDVFYGPVLFSLDGQRYESRLLASLRVGGSAYCQPVAPTCAVYTLAGLGRSDTQLTAIDPRGRQSYSIGAVQPRYDLRGLALHPRSGMLYATAGERGAQPGTLYTIDRATGVLTPIGSSGFVNITALAFRASDGTLWGWATDAGLIQIEPSTGTGTLRLAASQAIDGLAWDSAGAVLYAARGKRLWSYREGTGALALVADDLPLNTRGINLRPDGLLFGQSTRNGRVRLFTFNPADGKLSTTANIPTRAKKLFGAAWPQGCGNPSAGGRADMIKTIEVDKTTACLGEQIRVAVTAVHPESPGGLVDVSINGRWGSPQYLQLLGQPGRRVIQVNAVTSEKFVDTEQVIVEAVQCKPPVEAMIVTVRPNRFHRDVVDFEVANATQFSGQSPIYDWDFGDGQMAQTTVPYAPHYYGDSLMRNQLYTNFQVTVTLRRSGQPDLTTRKTVTVWNFYALSKQHGIIQPPVTADRWLQPRGLDLVIGSYLIINLEDEAVAFTQRQIEYQFCDVSRNSVPQPTEPVTLTLGPRQQLLMELALPASALTEDICGVAMLLSGQGPGGLPAFATAVFDVQRNPLQERPVTDPRMQELLNQIVAQKLVPSPWSVTEEDLYRLDREGKITYPLPPAPAQVMTEGPYANQAVPPTENDVIAGQDIIGQPCAENNPPPRLGVVCTPNGQWKDFAPRIANARKGDVILTPGCGLIGSVLRSVSPPQIYSHSGLVVEDYTQIRHSTASEDRYGNNLDDILFFPDVNGIETDVLRYSWPGILTQSVDEAYNGERILSPEGKFYTIDGFNARPAICRDDINLGIDVVVKPMPGSDPTVRERLRAAADIAKTINGHYRLFAYTNAAIAGDRSYDAPADLRWDVRDTRIYPEVATVCSSFIWYAMNLAGIKLEGLQLEENDMRLGAERDAATLDGLYKYTEAERLAGVYQLIQGVEKKAVEKQGDLAKTGEALFGAITKLQNQTANCFGFDDCGNKAKARWKNPGVGRAVSPDNILFWDAPATGGVYGFSEQIDYHGGEFIQLGTWQPSPDAGTLAGRVLFEGQGVVGAAIRVVRNDPNRPDNGGFIELVTGGDGGFSDNLLPAGQYIVVGSASINGAPLSKQADVTINAGQTTTLELVLEVEPDFFREVRVIGTMFLLDHENTICIPFIGCVNEDEKGSFRINETRVLDPFNKRRDEIRLGGKNSYCVGDEVRVELDLQLRLEDDNRSVAVTGEARLYEGTDCATDEKEDTEPIVINLAPGSAASRSIRLENPYGLGGGDWAKIDFLVINVQAPRTAAAPITPHEGGTLAAPDGALQIVFPPAAVTSPVTVLYNRLSAPTHALSSGQRALHRFTLDAYQADGTAVSHFGQPYHLVLSYRDSDLATAQVDESSLRLVYWDGAGWADILPCAGCTVDAEHNQVTVILDHFTEFALIGRASPTIWLPIILR